MFSNQAQRELLKTTQKPGLLSRELEGVNRCAGKLRDELNLANQAKENLRRQVEDLKE